MTIDWDQWQRDLVHALDHRAGPPDFPQLFAPGGTFQDPAHAPTEDVAAVTHLTGSVFPDWHTEVRTFRHGEDWAVFEWDGHGSFVGTPDGKGKGAPILTTGMTTVEVDADGRITRWRDYLDRQEPIDQIKAALGV
jgi:hypothetical protein